MAYELKLPEGYQMHDVFHVSYLKNGLGQHFVTSTKLPPLDKEEELILILEKILETRERKLRNMTIKEYLLKWKDLHVEYATLEGE